MKCLLMGSGVQTTAILIKYWKNYDFVIFADTGGESPETYEFIENYLKPFCQSKSLEWVTVKRGEQTLEEYCLENKQIPSRMFKWCTDKFKQTPVKRELKKRGATRKNPIICDVGFSLDESHRLGNKKPPQYMVHNFPLIDDKLTRRDCYSIISEFGFPEPPKSACYYCFNAKKKEIINLKGKHPELFDRMNEMEINAGRKFFNVPLQHFNEIQTLDDFSCDSGSCMT